MEFQEKRKSILNYLSQEILLINSDYIRDNTHTNERGFEKIKLDSISFLESAPKIDKNLSYSLKGYICCYKDFLIIEAERIPDGLYYPTQLSFTEVHALITERLTNY